MAPSNFGQEEKKRPIDDFEKILLTYGVTLAQPKESLGVSNIGVPGVRLGLGKIREKGAMKLLLARGIIILGMTILLILSSLSENIGIPSTDILEPFVIASGQAIFEAIYTIYSGYIFVPMSMIIISLVFLYQDYFLLASSKKARTKFPWDWLILSLAVILLGGFTFGIVLETTLLQILLISMDTSGPNVIIIYGLGIMIITIPFTLRAFITRYVHWRNPTQYRIESKVKAVREYILSLEAEIDTDSPKSNSEEIIRAANRLLVRTIFSRAMFGTILMIVLLSFIWFRIGQFVSIALIFETSLIFIAVMASSAYHWILKKRIQTSSSSLENTTGSYLIFSFFIAIPFAYLSFGVFFSFLFVGSGILSAMIFIYYGKKLPKDYFSILGYYYCKYLLHLSNEETAWNFVEETLSELRAFMNENYLEC